MILWEEQQKKLKPLGQATASSWSLTIVICFFSAHSTLSTFRQPKRLGPQLHQGLSAYHKASGRSMQSW